jgi:hypothetical protein
VLFSGQEEVVSFLQNSKGLNRHEAIPLRLQLLQKKEDYPILFKRTLLQLFLVFPESSLIPRWPKIALKIC